MKHIISRRATINIGLAAATGGFLAFSVPPLAAQEETGTPAEAKRMLDRAVAAMKADKTKALSAFSNAEKGFLHRDLYVFCFGPDGKVDAHPNPAMRGKEAKGLKDRTGKAYGEEMLRVAQEGKISRVDYLFPRLGSSEPVPKSSYVTRIDDHICGVGYYDLASVDNRITSCDLACQHGGR